MSALEIFLEIGGEDFSVIAICESTGALADCDIILESKVRRNVHLKRHCEFLFLCLWRRHPFCSVCGFKAVILASGPHLFGQGYWRG
jgi:hypothetical protein